MCPVTMTALSMAIAIASGVANHMQQEEQTKAQVKYQEEQGRAYNEAAVQNAQNAIKEQTEQTAAERISQMQDQASTSQKIQDLQTERLRAQGAAAASSRAAGTAFDMLMADYRRVESQKKDILQHQREMSGVQSDIIVQNLRDKAESRINSQQRYVASPVSQPSWGLTALSISGDVVSKGSTFAYSDANPWKD